MGYSNKFDQFAFIKRYRRRFPFELGNTECAQENSDGATRPRKQFYDIFSRVDEIYCAWTMVVIVVLGFMINKGF